ncbi:MAG: ABC transporter ATP-binding protein [Parcubacteria group bacterium]|nr:ABC transporter ATP-binding protein [Parcubacteria group bacterium]
MRDIRPFLLPYRWKFIVATLFRFAADIAWLYPAYGLAVLVTFFTKYTPGASLAPVKQVFVLWMFASIVRYVGMYAAKRIMFAASEQMALDAQLKTVNHLFLLDMGWHEHENSGNKLKKIERGGQSIDRIFRMWINAFIEIGVNFFGIIFILAKFDFTTVALTLGFLATYYVIAFVFRRKASAAAQVVNMKEEEMNGLFFESINNIRSVKVMSMRRPISEMLRNEAKDLYGKVLKRLFWFQTGNSLRGFYANTFRIGVSAFIVYGILHGHYEVGFLILFNTYFMQITTSISELAEVTQEFIIAKLSIGRMTDILREPVGTDKEEGKMSFPKDWQKIVFNKVSFSYGDNEVLSGVSFEVRRGERVGIIGLSGAGKSTLFKLLLKEREPSGGEILIDSIPLEHISKEDYFRHTAAVLQETEVFNFTLRQNIALANNEEAENNELFEKSLHIAHVSDFLSKLPQGADTLIVEKGVKLSGGEKQRLGLARAVFKQPEILLLDEATSHLDVESEEKIRSSLHEFFQSVTALVIAHRLTTVREMDKIIVIEDGKIIEEGSFDELHQKRGRFYELWEKQKL